MSDPVDLEVTAVPVDVVVLESLLDPVLFALGAAITGLKLRGPLDEEEEDEPLASEGNMTLPGTFLFRANVGTLDVDEEDDEDFPPERAFLRS